MDKGPWIQTADILTTDLDDPGFYFKRARPSVPHYNHAEYAPDDIGHLTKIRKLHTWLLYMMFCITLVLASADSFDS